jgi:hypothetical protein
MRRATWTYELPPGGSGAAGIEDYMLLDERGKSIGKVAVVLERDGTRYVVGDIPASPFGRNRCAFPWGRVAAIDHEALSVLLAPDAMDAAIQLDSDRAVENRSVENRQADARRVTELATEARGTTTPGRGPVDSQRYLVAFAVGVAALLAALAAVVVMSVADGSWRFATIAVPVALGIGAVLAVHWMLRRPYS